MLEILKYELSDIVRSKWIVAYALMFFGVSFGLYLLGGNSAKSIVSLLNIVLLVVPLFSMLFGIVYLHNLRSFLELLLSQPVERRSVYLGSYLGVSLPLTLALVLGLGLSFAFYGQDMAHEAGSALALMLSGVLLTFVFTALAFLISTIVKDQVKGFATCLLLWLYMAVIHDGAMLLLISWFSEYPVENAAMILGVLNPVGMARILILLNLDISALMGLTGTLFHNFVGSQAGMSIAIASLIMWIISPLAFGLMCFQRKDF